MEMLVRRSWLDVKVLYVLVSLVPQLESLFLFFSNPGLFHSPFLPSFLFNNYFILFYKVTFAIFLEFGFRALLAMHQVILTGTFYYSSVRKCIPFLSTLLVVIK